MASADELADLIAEELQKYTDDVEQDLEQAKQDVAKESVQKLKTAGSFGGKKYRKGWSQKKNGTAVTVYNRTSYQLTHLLEFGHALKRGGRTVGSTRAFEHIAPVDEWVADEFERRVKVKMGH